MNAVSPGDAAGRLVSRGLSLLRAGQHQAALPLLDLAAGLPDAPVAARGLLAEALLETGRAREALDTLAAVTIAGTDVPLLLLRARAHRALGHALRALDDAAAAVLADPRGDEARQIFAACLSDAGRHDEAIVVFGELLEEAPDDVQRLAWLGTALLRGRRFAAAEETLVHAVTLRPGVAQLWILRSELAFQQREYERAAALAREGLALVGPDAVLLSCLGAALHRLGERAQARRTYEEASRLRPDDGYLAHLAGALAGTDAAAEANRASDGYVRQLFDQYAERFEESLLSLGYRVPGLIRRTIERLRPDVAKGAKLGPVLDLGCGTGLVGVVLHDLLGGPLTGVDLSPRMVEAARAKDVYAKLHVAEIGVHLAADEGAYEWIVAADVFCYFGALDGALAAIVPRLAPRGRLVFTVERGQEGDDWALSPTARYRHARSYVRSALEAAGLEVELLEDEVLRQEGGERVEGMLVVAHRAGATA